MDAYNTVVLFFQEGGIFMYPIVAVFALGLAITLERYVYLSLARVRNRQAWNRALPLLQAGKFDDARSFAQHSNTAVARLLGYGLGGSGELPSKQDAELAMEEGMMELVPRLEKRTHYLSTLANIATLLGLLGTIIGLIQAFTAVSAANAAEKADLLSSSISVAMNTTALGLIVGIPLLLVHAVLQAKTMQLVDSLEMAAVKVLNSLKEHTRRAAKAEAAAA
jgi:biopolymer transport protein ExbB